ncbi:uncharacterized protein LOC18099685 isoform X1 [Populus trichocarpa]|uniref:Uncharacterized protein n=1 Tax=Populus trichocarpa TaxID=3694 RepID=U5GDP4_POPTR|nr:uncharacterized protein LOC18099685 isoform X1 [Populus trichocarpa]|eukprot:XP_006383738.1 uncharacterized protein LOC18099685 isoform X1 [Populus trichocarpa]
MTLPPGPYSGASALALVARASAFSFGLVYGSVKLKILKLALLGLFCLLLLYMHLRNSNILRHGSFCS